MIKGQVVSGNFSQIMMRVKAKEEVEIGELLIIDHQKEKFLVQVYDLVYGSQISAQNLEMVAGLNLEEGNFNLLEEELRNYQLALLKPILSITDQNKTCKKLPAFFARVQSLTKED